MHIIQNIAGRVKSRKACLLILLAAIKFETQPNQALTQLLAACCFAAILSWEHWLRREIPWPHISGSGGFIASVVLVGQMRGTIKSVVSWQALRNARPACEHGF